MVLFQLVLLTTGAVKGQDPYYWKLTDENGLPSQTVYQVMQDRNGLIWIATANGICSFDGKLVQNYDCSALNDQEILKIQEDQEGNIWGLNLSGQLFCLSGGKVSVVNKLGEIVLIRIIDFVISEDKIILGQLDKDNSNTNLIKFNLSNSDKYCQVIKVEGLLYALQVNNGDVISYSGIKIDSYMNIIDIEEFKTIGSKILLYNCHSKHFFCDGKVIIVPRIGNTVNIIDLESRKQICDFKIGKVTKNVVGIDGLTYLMLNEGVMMTDFSKRDFILGEISVNGVYKDREDCFYFPSNEGVIIIPQFNQKNITKNTALLSDKKTTRLEKIGEKGQVLTSMAGALKILAPGRKFRFVHKFSSNVTSVMSSRGEINYIGTDEGLFEYPMKSAILRTAIKDLYLSKNNLIYFGASHAFGKFYQQRKSIAVIENLRTYAISETRDGMIWVGSDKGIYTYDGKNFKPFIDNVYKCHFPFRVTDMKTDAHGKLWVTTIGHGVLVISNNKIENIFNKNYKLTTNTIYCVTFDDDKVWLGTAKGVFRCQYKSKNFLNINKYYGLPSDEIFALCADKENLLIGTSKGLVSMPYDVMEPNLIPPNIHLKRLMVNDSALSLSKEKHRLKYWQNNLFIEYISYQYRSKGDARYEYRISELDTNWTITDQRYLKFTNLSPGSYHFEIRAVNECDVRSNDVIRLYFDIAKPVWLEWWFLLGSVASAGFGAWYISYKTFKNRQKILEKEGEFKARIEDLRNQALQAQMNPHFIFNSLNAVQHYLSQNDKDNAVRFLSKFAGLIRMVFEFSKRKEISLNSELEMLDLYLSLEQLRFEKTLELIYEVSDELKDNQEAILLPPLLIQPIIENSFRHGLFHKNDKGKLIVKFELVYDHHLKCTVEDDGVGRKKAESMPSWKPSQYSSSGLISTEERIKYWHQKNNTGISDCFTIEDLYSNNKACGTRVTMIL